MIPWDSEAERELLADACARSFFLFCTLALGYSRPEFTWWSPRVHQPFCNWFQGHVEAWEASRRLGRREQRHLMVVVHREFGKTMIITKAGQLWMHLRDPNLSTYIGSSTVTRAGLFFSPIKEVLMGNDPDSLFSWLYGNWYDKSRTWSADAMTHAARGNMARTEPSIGTWGVETGLVGMHPDAGFMDDPIDYEKMGTDAQWLTKVNSHLHALAPVFKADALFVYTGTRYHDADAIGEAMRSEKARTVEGMPMPGILPQDDGKWHVYFRAARDDKGRPTYPENWPESRLRDYERSNSLQYASQLMNAPNTGQHVPLLPEQVDKLWVKREEIPRDLRYSLHIDTAFKNRETMARGDESVIQLWGHTRDGSGDVYFLEGYGSSSWRVEDFNNQLVILLQKLKRERRWPYALTDEAEIGGKTGTWELTLQSWCHAANLATPALKMLNRSGKKKVMRIIQAATYWVDGHVKLVVNAPGVNKLVDQMLRIGTSAHDDWADAAADVFSEDVYVPMRRNAYRDPQPEIRRPYDDELQGALNLYDAYVREEDWRREHDD